MKELRGYMYSCYFQKAQIGDLIKIKRTFLVTLLTRVFLGPKKLKFADARELVLKFTQLFWNSNRKSLKSATNKLLVKLMALNKKEGIVIKSFKTLGNVRTLVRFRGKWAFYGCAYVKFSNNYLYIM